MAHNRVKTLAKGDSKSAGGLEWVLDFARAAVNENESR